MSLTDKDWQKIMVVELGVIVILLLFGLICDTKWCW